MRIASLMLAAAVVSTPAAWAQDGPVVIKAATVFDGTGRILRNTAIVVSNGRIARVDPSAQGTTYDLAGLTVMPGWIETHAHIASHFDRETGRIHNDAESRAETIDQTMLYTMENAYRILVSGFTTVQSPGAEIDKNLRDWIADGRVPGPRILTSLRSIRDDSGTPDQIRAEVRRLVADGADFIKLFATKSIREGGTQSMSDAQIQAACGEARALGKRTLVHAQGPEGARAAVLAGCTTIEHGNRLTDEVLDLMVKHGTYFDSNNHLLLHNYLENKEKFFGIGNYNEEGFRYMAEGLPIGNDTFKRALSKGVKIVQGTDAVAGAHGRMFEEMIYRVRDGGQKPMEAIVAATSMAADSLNMGTQIGRIAPGMQADIIATDGNPLDDITALRRVVFVMKGGKIYKNERPAARSSARATR
ncbi:MAG TPA: amidohydrolase family protein [Vicinamibacterales bacterium]